MSRVNRLRLCALILFLAATVEAAVFPFPPAEELRSLENPNQRDSASPRAEENYRLPNETVPIHYSIELTTSVHNGETPFSGKVIITLEVVEDTDHIVVHARQLREFTASIKSVDAGATDITLKDSYEEEREFLTLSPTDTSISFAAGTQWLLTIEYKGDLRTDNGGFYLSTFTGDNGETRYLATTQFESTDARHAFPCYDEPAKRATFDITLNHDPSYNAISNMPKNETKSTDGVTVFETTVNMPTYLIAFIVSDFVSTEGELNGLPQRVFSRKGTEHEQEWALTSGMLLEKRLSGYFDVPFALPKLDQAALPDFAAGAMENWGLATYREEYLLYNSETSTVNTQTNIATIEAHEDAHMWFGDLVAIEWWGYLWLKEGFATLFENLATDLAYPEWDIFQTFHAGSYQSALNYDASPTARPMSHYVEKPSEISLLYDSVSYAKAGSVLDMWRHALTNKVFQRGLHNYLTANQFSAANENDLFEAIAIAAKEENYPVHDKIVDMLPSWTRQGGVPLLTVERNYNDGSFTVKQHRYTNDKDDQNEKKWYIPLNYAVQTNPDFRDTEATHYLLNEESIAVSDAKVSNEAWLILNKQSTGYYRINYDDRNWQLIIDGLIDRPHKIHPRNRAQLISDLYRFATSGRVPHSTLLTLLTYLPKEDQYAPWSTANTAITLFNRYLSGDKDYDNFRFYVSELVSEQYDKFGVNDVHGEQHLAKFTRNLIINLACLAGLDSCLKETSAKLEALVNEGKTIEPNLQSPVYCNGLKQTDDSVYNFVYEKLMDSTDQAERRLLISSLGCSQNSNQVNKFVSSSIDAESKLRVQERITLLSSAYSRGEVGLLTSIEFLNEHWQEYGQLNTGFGGVNPLYSDIVGMSAYVVNENQKTKLQELVDKVKGSEYVPTTLQDSVDANTNANFQWLETNRDPLINWVTEKYRTGGGASLTTSFATISMAIFLIVTRLF
ncbi:aminopeptidase N [Scaptodrosophila lebanonensis]|uniref:Aminopeptidase n=1 Tax=Drosophila lebanonensis TaxID=7225 RepID=A0A6J2T626_DROLE|nr:aminopeptidase N [Scaptodrosophila lebanonensis]